MNTPTIHFVCIDFSTNKRLYSSANLAEAKRFADQTGGSLFHCLDVEYVFFVTL